VVGIDLNDDTTEALLDELGRRGLMPGRPDTASMEAALRSLATSWDAEAAGGRVSRGLVASRGLEDSRGGVATSQSWRGT
jgi:hypothetical protein